MTGTTGCCHQHTYKNICFGDASAFIHADVMTGTLHFKGKSKKAKAKGTTTVKAKGTTFYMKSQ